MRLYVYIKQYDQFLSSCQAKLIHLWSYFSVEDTLGLHDNIL